MAAVFKAYDPSLNRTVAIKLLDEELARQDPQFVESFIHEAQTAASINHPNIVQIYFVGEENGNYYIAMELLEGRSLDEIIKEEGPQSEETVLNIGIQIAEALSAAYANQMVHGDIKPQNIFITSHGVVKLLDFGLAKMANIESSAESDGSVWGSAFYISPERVGHKAEDFRSDIYSLGASLFHALVGHPPFDADTPEELAQMRLNEKAPTLRRINPDISAKTEQIIARMLNKSIFLRYLDYDSLLKDLQTAELKTDEKPAIAFQPLQSQNPGTAALAAKARGDTGILRTTSPVSHPVSRPVPAPSPRVGLKNDRKILMLSGGAGALLLIIIIAILVLHGKHEPAVQAATGIAASAPVADTPRALETSSKDSAKTINQWNLADFANQSVPNQVAGGRELRANIDTEPELVTKDNVRVLHFSNGQYLMTRTANPTHPFSVEVKMAVESLPVNYCSGIYEAMQYQICGFRLLLARNLKLGVDIYINDQQVCYLVGQTPLEIGRFYDVTLKFDGKKASLFLDGKLDAEIESPLPAPFEGDTRVGLASGQDFYFNGFIQSVRITEP